MKKLMYFAVALLVLVGCQKKENVIENTPQNFVTITGGIDFSAQDGPNKVAAKEGWENVTSGNKVGFVWEEGDKIAVLNMSLTEVKQFTVTSISEDKQTATFTGEPLSGGMGSYTVMYPYEYGEASVHGTQYEFFANQQYTGKLRPAFVATGSGDSFNVFTHFDVFDLSLKGSVTLGKIKYHTEDGGKDDAPYDATLSFGDGGLQLTNEPQHVTFTTLVRNSQGFKLSFYDTDDQLIMEKISTKNITETGILSFPTLEVKAATPTVDPKDIFDEGAKMNFKLTFDPGGEIYYEFNYTNNGSGFTCDKIIENNNDVTSSHASECPVTLTGNYTFRFQLGPAFTLDYDGANKTYKCGGEYSPWTTITDFKVNDVSIFDQLTDITE